MTVSLATALLIGVSGAIATLATGLVAYRQCCRRKELEQDSQALAESLKEAQEFSRTGTWRADMADGLSTWSEQMYRLCGRAPPDLSGRRRPREDLLKILAPSDRPKLMQAIERSAKEQKPFELEHRVILADGSQISCISRGQLVERDGKQYIVGATQDVTEQVRMEESLRDAEARFLAFMDHSPFSAWMRAEGGQLVYCNERFAAHMGMQPHELVISGDRTMWLSKDYVERSIKDDKRVLELGRSSENIEHVPMQDGSVRHWLVLKFPIRSQAGEAFVGGVSLDLTARYEADEKLRASEKRLRSVMQSASEGIVATDSEGRIISWNAAAERILGFTEEEVLGSELKRLLSAAGIAEVSSFPPEEEIRSLVVQGVRKDGQEFQLELSRSCWRSGTQAYATLLLRDVTERQHLESQLRVSEAQLRLTLDAALDAVPQIVWTAHPDGRLLFFSRKWFDYMGVSFPTTGQGWIDWVHPEDLAETSRIWQHALSTGESCEMQYRLLRGVDGTYRWHIGRALPVRDDSGQIFQWFGTSTDIHDHKVAQEEQAELRAGQAAALETSRLKSEFLAHMSHEIRTPLNGVIGMTDLMLETPLSSEQHSYADAIHRSAESLLDIINDILDFSKIEAGKLEIEKIDFDLLRAIEDVEKTLAFQAEGKGLKLEVSLEPSVPHGLRGDPGRLRQVLGNLLSNAIKFTARGHVQVRVVPEPGVSQAPGETRLRFEVEDTGVGIPASAIPRLFQPFSQADSSTSRRFGGSGLGLSICKRLVEHMGGQVGVSSQVGVGSTFWFAIPFELSHHKEFRASESASAGARPPASRSARVLVAEDNAINQMILLKILEKMGILADAVINGREVLTALEKQSYDLILMDCQMPEMDGYQATEQIRASEGKPYRNVPIVAVTASVVKGDREKCLALGMNDYVSKPVDQVDLKRVIATWLREDSNSQTDTAQEHGSRPGLRAERAIDASVIEELRSLDDGEGAVLRQLIELFVGGGPDRIEAIAKAQLTGDLKTLNAEAHTLKSSAANLGATAMAEICARLEQAKTPESAKAADAWVQQLRTEFQRASKELEAMQRGVA